MKEKTIIYTTIVILIATNLFMLYRLHFKMPNSKTNFNDNCLIYKDIMDSEEYTSYLEGQSISKKLLKNIVNSDQNNKYYIKIFDSPFIICTLFSTIGCTVCLDSEIKEVENLYNWINNNNLPASVIGIANSSSLETLLRFKRASGFTFPLFIDKNESISRHFRLKTFPITILIDTRYNIILRANHPINKKLEWSNHFYDYTRALIKNIYENKSKLPK